MTFEEDIGPVFANYVGCMANVVLPDEEGTEALDLSSYELVKRFHRQIQVAIHGYDEGSTAPHPMPRGGPENRLPQASIDKFDAWVEEGMPA